MLRQQRPGEVQLGTALYELVGCRPPSSSSSAAAAAEPQPEPAAGGGKAEQQQLRRKINSRERKRMQDLNLAMDALREVILPYSAAHCHGSPGRKLSKIATLLLARNYILLLGSSLQELRRILGELSGSGPRLLLAGLPLFAAPGSLLLAPGGATPPEGLRPAGKYLSLALDEPLHLAAGAGLCPCGVCKFPPFGLAALQGHFAK